MLIGSNGNEINDDINLTQTQKDHFSDYSKLFSDEYDDNIDFTYGQNTAIDGQTDGQSCATSLNGEMFVIGGAQHKTQVYI